MTLQFKKCSKSKRSKLKTKYPSTDETRKTIIKNAKSEGVTLNQFHIEAYLTEYDRWLESNKQVEELGLMVRKPNTDSPEENPFLAISRASARELYKIGVESGIDGIINTSATKPIGRPSKYKPDLCEAILPLFAEGMSIVEVSANIGINQDTFFDWIKKYPDFSESYKRGKALSAAWWEGLGRKGASGDKEINATTWIFNMKNRFAWHDRNMLLAALGETEPDEAQEIRKAFHLSLEAKRQLDADTSS